MLIPIRKNMLSMHKNMILAGGRSSVVQQSLESEMQEGAVDEMAMGQLTGEGFRGSVGAAKKKATNAAPPTKQKLQKFINLKF